MKKLEPRQDMPEQETKYSHLTCFDPLKKVVYDLKLSDIMEILSEHLQGSKLLAEFTAYYQEVWITGSQMSSRDIKGAMKIEAMNKHIEDLEDAIARLQSQVDFDNGR